MNPWTGSAKRSQLPVRDSPERPQRVEGARLIPATSVMTMTHRSSINQFGVVLCVLIGPPGLSLSPRSRRSNAGARQAFGASVAIDSPGKVELLHGDSESAIPQGHRAHSRVLPYAYA